MVVADDFVEEKARLFQHRSTQRGSPALEDFLVRLVRGEAAELQPLHPEILHERFGAFVFEHSADLRVEVCGEGFFAREFQQFLIRHRGPKEVAQPRGEVKFVQRMRLGIFRRVVGLHAEDELRRRENGDDGVADSRVQRRRGFCDGGDALDFLLQHRATPRVRHERRHPLPNLHRRRLARAAAHPAFHKWRRAIHRAFDFEIFERHDRRWIRGGVAHDGHGDALGAFDERQLHLHALRVFFRASRHFDLSQHAEIGDLPDLFNLQPSGFFLLRFFEFRPSDDQRDAHRAARWRLGIHAGAEDIVVARRGAERRVQRPGADVVLARRHRAPVPAHRHSRRARLGEACRHIALHRRRKCGGDGHIRHAHSGIEIPFHKHRRDGEHVANIVKPVADIVAREIRSGLKIDAHQIADRVVVFHAVQPPERDATRVRLCVLIVVGEHGACAFEKSAAFILARLRLIVRRHLVLLYGVEDTFPLLPRLEQRPGIAKLMQHQIRLLLLLPVAGHAMLLHKRNARLFKRKCRPSHHRKNKEYRPKNSHRSP